jgi:amidohydrolase
MFMRRLFFLSLLLFLAAGHAAAQSADGGPLAALHAEIAAGVQRVTPRVVAWREDIHQHPELGTHEVRTAKLVADHLRSLGIGVRTEVGGHGVVGVLRGGKPGRVVGRRAAKEARPRSARGDVPLKSNRRGP